MKAKKRVRAALEVIERFGGIEGEHHKTWVIDQVARSLMGEERYEEWVLKMRSDDYDWSEGVSP